MVVSVFYAMCRPFMMRDFVFMTIKKRENQTILS
ncbi:hypothetical protein predicted by Glimmer/Critica [Streptococcus dysgalactiae subsp. equisimilis AC-2713]|uniref:Uncharacterized protein n=1 Tax=Streptococcus dysgalactiae subsp. equisimilis AC-2713 TaxID=759913 RepID=A0AB33R519_STREQ|nr:hypothetical protein predicted by Glimmer/Critica [Streptococcus dysgalactiae subsp. equisimilis AC-2713]